MHLLLFLRRGVTFFQGWWGSFCIKNKLKSEIYNDKKSIYIKNKNVFPFITKNLNWEILTQNWVNFKRLDGVKDEKFKYYRGSLKNLWFSGKGRWGGGGGGQVNKKQNIGKRAWTICRFKGGIVKKEGGLNFVAIILNQILLCL